MCWTELKKVNWWLFFKFLVSLMFIFLFSLISLLHPSASALLQLHLHYRSLFLRFSDARKRYHPFSSSSCCLVTSATSTNVGYNLWALSPLHTEILAVAYCCARPPALGRVRPLSPSPLDTCPSKHLPWSCKAMPYSPWPHCLAVLPQSSPLSLRALYTGVRNPHGV